MEESINEIASKIIMLGGLVTVILIVIAIIGLVVWGCLSAWWCAICAIHNVPTIMKAVRSVQKEKAERTKRNEYFRILSVRGRTVR